MYLITFNLYLGKYIKIYTKNVLVLKKKILIVAIKMYLIVLINNVL